MLSHELRNPLAPILNAVQILRFANGKDRIQKEAQAIIERQVGQLTRLIDDLMEISRITTGRICLNRERISLNTVVEYACSTVSAIASKHQHELSVSLPDSPIWIHADAARIEQVIVNILTNSVKYTADGGTIALTLELRGEEAVVRVRDSGVGIAPELLPRIFELFTQADRSLARSEGGLGIGLSLVQQLVKMHDGTVEAHSSLDQGSEFIVRLPALLADADSSIEQSPEPTAHVTGSCRVLVVDDSTDSADSMAFLLKMHGHDALVAYDGVTAMETALVFLPHLILLDIGLPDIDGYEFAKRMGNESALRDAVLVALTGYGSDLDRKLSKESGFDHHLTKPADFKLVLDILGSIAVQ
jgi:CheY-like chemotaxis protein/two-component sensor histidine kinase